MSSVTMKGTNTMTETSTVEKRRFRTRFPALYELRAVTRTFSREASR